VVDQNTRRSVAAIQGVVAVMDEVDTHAAAIAGAVTQQSAAVKHIAENANQVATAMGQVGEVVAGVSDAARESERQAAITQRSAATIDTLTAQLRAIGQGAAGPPRQGS